MVVPELQLYLISLPATATLHLLISVHSFIPSSMTHQQRLVQMRFKQLRHITVCSNLISSSILTLYTRLYTMSEVVAHSSNCNSSSHSCSNSSSPLCSSSSSSFILCRRTETMSEGSCRHLTSHQQQYPQHAMQPVVYNVGGGGTQQQLQPPPQYHQNMQRRLFNDGDGGAGTFGRFCLLHIRIL